MRNLVVFFLLMSDSGKGVKIRVKKSVKSVVNKSN